MNQDWTSRIDQKLLERLRASQLASKIQSAHWTRYRELRQDFPFPGEPSSLAFHQTIEIRTSPEQESSLRPKIEAVVEALLPWRTGPFNLFGVDIDGEWRSDYKWDRIAPFLPECTDGLVADVGCNSGYFLFRLLEREPAAIFGFDPSSRCYHQFEFLNSFVQSQKIRFEPLGIEHLSPFPNLFQVLFCFGVIYHRKDPYTACRQLYEAIQPNGYLFLESIVHPGSEPIALCPTERYAKMRNVWYLPTESCLTVWLERAGFKDIEVISSRELTTIQEQRRTALAPYESLVDFLDPNDPSKTVEGYDAPERSILMARK